MHGMVSKTYSGSSVAEVMELIKVEHGEDAMILNTSHHSNAAPHSRVQIEVAWSTEGTAEAAHEVAEVVGNTPASSSCRYEPAIEGSISTIAEITEKLLQQGMSTQTVALICSQLGKSGSTAAKLSVALERVIKFNSVLAGSSRFIAMIGPTGVGKTTTIGKLAAQLQITCGLRVGLIAADAFRVGATEHLHQYARILHAPFVALDPRIPFSTEIARALNTLEQCDLVFIDTAGCSPGDRARLSELKRDLECVPALERMLVAPAPINSRDLKGVMQQFGWIGYERLVLSKLDESGFIGPLIEGAIEARATLSFFATGQRVPEDIEPASAARLAWMMLRAVQ